MCTPHLTTVVQSGGRPQAFDRCNKLLLGLLLVVSPLFAGLAQAQDEELNDPLHAASYRAQKESASEVFLDPKQPKQARLEAATKLGYPEDQTFESMLRLGADATADDEIRWQALRQHRFDDDFLDVVLSILEDPNDGGGEFVGELIENLSRRTTFKLAAPVEQRIRAVLRDLLDDPHERVRVAAFRSLIGGHDTVAVNRLVEALNAGEDEVPIPLAEAISLIDQDGSIYHIQTLQPYLDHKHPSVQAQAARALVVDPVRRPQIVDLAINAKTPEEVRQHALRALAREDEGFLDYAIELMADRGESVTIRHAAMKALAGRMNYREVEDSQQILFAKTVEEMIDESTLQGKSGEQLRSEAKMLLAYLQKAFPAVELHYDLR